MNLSKQPGIHIDQMKCTDTGGKQKLNTAVLHVLTTSIIGDRWSIRPVDCHTCMSPIVPVKHSVTRFMNTSHLSATTMSMSHWLPAGHCGHHLRDGLDYFYDDRGASTECVLRLPTDGPLHHHTWWHIQELHYNGQRQTSICSDQS